MGIEIRCRIRTGRTAVDGVVLLESKELIVRPAAATGGAPKAAPAARGAKTLKSPAGAKPKAAGPKAGAPANGARTVIPFASIVSLKVKGDWLEVEHAGGRVAIELGAEPAARWADRIRTPRTLLDKLGVKPGQRLSVVGLDVQGFVRELSGRDVMVSDGRIARGSDLVFLGLSAPGDLRRIAGAGAGIVPDGGVWAVWPKGRPELREDDVRAAARAAGLVDVKVVSFSETLSALKLVIPKARR